jgi:hypothetical protein
MNLISPGALCGLPEEEDISGRVHLEGYHAGWCYGLRGEWGPGCRGSPWPLEPHNSVLLITTLSHYSKKKTDW